MHAQPTDVYEAAFDRALAGAQRIWRSSPTLSREAARRLARSLVAGRREMALRNASIPLVDALVERATDLSGRDSSRAFEAAELAVAVANRLDPSKYANNGARLRALTSLIARSKDVADFRCGEKAADEAWEIFRQFGYGPDDEIDCLLATGYLYYTMDALKEVFFFAEDALNLARELGDSERVARSLKLLSLAHSENGEHREAILSLWKARKLTTDSRLQFACCQNLATSYCALGHFRAARSLLVQAAGFASADLGYDYELRLLWTRARIDAHAGQVARVVETLETVAEGFLQLGRPQTFAAATTEIALALAEHGDGENALELAEQSAGWFRALGMERDAVAATAIAGHVKGRAMVKRALVALSVSINKRAGRQASPLSH